MYNQLAISRNRKYNTNNGTVNGVCMGTGIQDNFTQYNERGTDYWQSSPGGVGVVLRACVAIKKMLQK